MKKLIENFTFKDALELAIQIELQAKERYEEFSRQIGSQSKGDAGDFFATMAISESKHAETLINKCIEHFGKLSPDIFIEDYYEFSESEAPEFDKAQSFMSVLSALQVVRESEIKAYNFYKKMSESSTDSEVKRFFIELMEEEDEHRKMVEDQINKLDESNEPLRDKDDIEEPNGL